MKELKDKFIITFPSTTQAMAMESYCRSNNVPGRLIPVPTQISAGCGLCWCAEPEDEEICSAALKLGKIEFENCVKI